MNIYAKQREPYITFIHLWDDKKDGLLCSKYDPLKIGNGEPGMKANTTEGDTPSSMSSSSTRISSLVPKRKGLEDATVKLSQVMDSMMKYHEKTIEDEKPKRKKARESYEDLELEELQNLFT